MAQLKNTTISDTGSLNLPAGTTAQRPSSPVAGQIRYNTTINDTEYYDGAAWRPISDSNPEATGGTIVDTDIGGVPYRIHYFTNTGNSTFAVARGGEVEYLIVAGGGGGGVCYGGGGGAGGLVTGTATVTTQTYTITVGVGGTNQVNVSGNGGPGGNSTAFGLTAIGGGFGGGNCGNNGGGGGSGGGGSGSGGQGGSGTSGQGNNGAPSPNGSNNLWGGGGGGGGSAGVSNNGGTGLVSSLSGNNIFYAGGGQGSLDGATQTGGLGGGGAGGIALAQGVANAVPNTGGGGGGTIISGTGVSGIGGSGIVIVRYRRNASTASAPSATELSLLPLFYTKDTRPAVSRDGLILELDAANSLSYPGTGTTWTDISNNSNNGTLQNGVGYTEQNYGSLTFDASNQWVSISVSSPLIQNDFTHTAWAIRNGNSNSSLGGIFGNHFHTQLAGAGMFFYNNSSTVNLSAGNGSSRPAHQITLPRSNQLWNFYVIRYSGTTYQFYFNGQLLDSRTAPVVQSANTNQYAVGRWAPSYGSYYLNGRISYCSSYNRALSPQEILQNFTAARSRYGI